MTYIKDIKVCIDCFHFSKPDKCTHPESSHINPVNGDRKYFYAITMRSSDMCGTEAKLFELSEVKQAENDIRRREFEEACRDAPF